MVLPESKKFDDSEQSETPVDSEVSEKSIDPEQSETTVLSKQSDKSNDSEQSERTNSSKQSEKSNDSGREGERPRSSRRQLALVYRAESPGLDEEEINEANKETNSFEVKLPRWRNRVHVYTDMKQQRGYTATLRLDRLGLKKNWKRHLNYNYRWLHVKGKRLDLL